MYQWANVQEWIRHKIYAASHNELIAIASILAEKHYDDDIQDLFQREMEQDGYFEQDKGND